MKKVETKVFRNHRLVSFRLILIIFFIFSGLLAKTQSLSKSESKRLSKAESKLEKFYNKKPEKCIKYANKLRKKGKYKGLTYYYCSISCYRIYKSSDKQRDLTKSFLNLEKSVNAKFDFNLNGNIDRISEIENAMIEFIDIDIENKKYSRAEKYSKKYFKIFNKQIPDYAKISELIRLSKVKPEPKQSENTVNTKENKSNTITVNPAKLVSDAKSVVGTKYKYGGETKDGLDCSGFNVYVYRQSGINLPHSAQMQSGMGETVNKENCRPGDLIFFGSRTNGKLKVQHAGMILSNEDGKIKIIHCPSRGVIVEGEGDPSYDMYWEKRFLHIKRISNN